MWKNSLQLDKYQYMRTSPFTIRTIGLMGIIATLSMAYGFSKYIHLDLVYIIFFGPIITIFIINKILRFMVQLFYSPPTIEEHEEFISRYWSVYEEPNVDIFLPWAGEDLRIHEEVVKAATNLNYHNYKVYMLDDVGSEEHKQMAERYGCIYLSRPNKGLYKKSGNLQYGYEHSNGEYILILDADFIPIKDVLHDLIPYIDSDNQMGILQTPQYFEQTTNVHKRSMIEFGGGNIVEDFYRIIMPCRDEFQAAMCVGTSAIYRKTAIDKLEGTPKVHASEDLATGLMITQFGYYVKYLPLIVSMGKSPDTYQGYFKQHMRWCSGNLVFARYWPRARLNPVARLIYLINPMYYLSEAATVIFSFQFLILLYFHSESLSLMNTLYFLPYIILSRIIIPFTKTNKNKLGTRLAALSNSYTYFYTYIRMITKGVPAWHPTGVKIKVLHDDFLSAYNIGTTISCTFLLCFIFVLISKPNILGNYNTYIVLGWAFYSAFWHATFITFVLQFIHPFRVSEVKSDMGRTFVYFKTHLVLVLFITLIGSSIADAIFVFQNPNNNTTHAFNWLKKEYDRLANEKSQNSDILGVTVRRIDQMIRSRENTKKK
jgi:cellulose synthase (UDP-forming)